MPDARPPAAARRPTTLRHFDDVREDDYYWLRDRDDPDVLAYLAAENDYASARLAATAALEQRVYDELVGRIEETDVTAPVRWGDWWYYERTFEKKSYPVHCRRRADAGGFPTELDGPGEEVVLDENALAEGHGFLSVGVLEPSPDHRLVAVGVDFEGNERYSLSFRSLDGGVAPSEVIDDVGYGAAWSSDGRALLYLRLDEAWRPHELWRHVLGGDPADDVLLVREDDERFRVSVHRTRDDAAMLVHVASAMTTEVRALSAVGPAAAVVLWPRRQGVECAVEHLTAPDGSGWWLATTNDAGATDFKVLAARDDEDVPSWREIVPEQPGRRVVSVDAFSGTLVVAERRDGAAALRLLPLARGDDPFGDDLEARGIPVESDEVPAATMLGATPEFDVDEVRVVQTSLVSPLGSFDVELATGRRTLRKRQPVRGGYDRARFASSRLWVTARDGARIPVSLVVRRDLLKDPGDVDGGLAGPVPLLLYGYGAYEISIDPSFSSARLSLLERGVAYAIAHVRGGGELGRAWYEGGRLEHKVTSFLDFVDVARAVVELGYTTPERLAAMGGSAGGLLMGASVNLAPEAFHAVVAEVPFVDVLSTMLDASIPLTVGEWEEWGDPLHDPEAYARMKAWSPYDNVAATGPTGTPRSYPDLLVLGSLNDTRVQYWEPAKWVARLRATVPDADVILKTDLGAGHAGPSGRYDSWRERALVYAWVLERLGVATVEPEAAR